ncbi:uncharacterized protein LOC143237490 isoform X2 [Tachypleus tridentatus]|uniref:uncharacterized protein LOC143237490 isoform X2 n=1 Tax=Tachypleus tridentatus TaxID=6853 RepID=UPI003FD1B230
MRQLIILFVLQGFAHFVAGLSLDDFRLLNPSHDQGTFRTDLETAKRRRRQFEDGPVPPYYFDIPNKELSEITRGKELPYSQIQKSGEINEPEDVSFDSSVMDNKIMWVAKEIEKYLERADQNEKSIDYYNTPFRINDANERQDNYNSFDMGMEFPDLNNHIGSVYDRKWKRLDPRLNEFKKRNLEYERYFPPYSEYYPGENLRKSTDVFKLDTFPSSRDDESKFLDINVDNDGLKIPDEERNTKNDEDRYYPAFQIQQDLIPRFQSSVSIDNYRVMNKPMPRKNKMRSEESSKSNKNRVPSYDFQNYYRDMAMLRKKNKEIEDVPNLNNKQRVPSDFELADLQEQHRLMAMSRKKKTNIADSLDLLGEENISSDLQDGLQGDYRSMVLPQLKSAGNVDFPELRKYKDLFLDTKTSKPQEYHQFRDMPEKDIMLYESSPSVLEKSNFLKPVMNISDIYRLGMMTQNKRKTVEIPESTNKFTDDSLPNLQELKTRRTLKNIFHDQRRMLQVPGLYSFEGNYEEGDFLGNENKLPILSEEQRLVLKKRKEHFHGNNDNKGEKMLGELKNIFKDGEERNRVQKRQEGGEEEVLDKSSNNDDIETQNFSDEQNNSQDKPGEDLPDSNKGMDFEKWLRKEYIKTMAQALNTMKRKRSKELVPIVSHDLKDNFRKSINEETYNVQNSKNTQTPKSFEEYKQSDQKRVSKDVEEIREDEGNGQIEEMNKIDNPKSTFQFSLAENKIKDIEESMLNEAIDMIQRNTAEGSRSDLMKAIYRIRAAKDLDEIGRALNHLESTLGQVKEENIPEESNPSIPSYFRILRDKSDNGEIQNPEEEEDIESAEKRNEEDVDLHPDSNKSFFQSLADSETTSSDEHNKGSSLRSQFRLL